MFRSDRGRRREDVQRSLSHSITDASAATSGWFQRPSTRSTSHRRQHDADMADWMSRSGPATQFSRLHTNDRSVQSTPSMSDTQSSIFKSLRGGTVMAPTSTRMGIAATAGGMHSVHWEGQVRKKGDWLPRWESRYLVLDGTVLRYYSKQDDARLGKHLRGKLILTHVSPEIHKKKEHTFAVETTGRKMFFMSCDTELEKDMWVEMIQAAISEAAAPQRQHANRHGQPPLVPASSAQHHHAMVPPTMHHHDPRVFHELQPPVLTKNSIFSSVADTPRDTVHADIRDFYNALRKLLLSHSSSAQFFPKLGRDIALTSNYAPTVPFWGDYHGLDGILHFFSILYDNVDYCSFFVTDIAYTTDGRTAVVSGRETMVNKANNRKFTQQWQHALEIARDGRVKAIAITADPIAASAVFGCNAMSSLRLPRSEYDMDFGMSSTPGASSTSWQYAAAASTTAFPNGLVQVHVVRGEQLGGLDDDDDDVEYDVNHLKDMAMASPYSSHHHNNQRPSSAATSQRHSTSYMFAFCMEKTPAVQGSMPTSPVVARTEAAVADTVGDPRWHGNGGDVTVPFEGAVATGQPCFVKVEAWKMTQRRLMSPLVEDSTQDDNESRHVELLGVAKINLSPFIALAQSRPHVDTMPQWYTLLSVGTTPAFACGRVLLSVHFEALGNHNTRSPSRTPMPIVTSPATTPIKLYKQLSYADARRTNRTFQVGNTMFDVPARYEMIKAVGQGAYGCVIAASDIETGQSLAIKNVPNAFSDLIDAKRILREIRLMQHLRHPKLVNLVDLFRPPSLHDFEDVYIVTELMETDLHRVINSNQILSDDHIQHFLYQMLVAVKFVHSANVLHRDLKPSNILVNADCDIKLCDFGLARGLRDPLDNQQNEAAADQLTDYVVTRWYRAPEVLLTCAYGKPMDMWAIGCILAELIGRRPLFPGTDFLHQLKIIMEVVGTPDESTLDFVTHAKAKRFITKQPKRRPIQFASLYPRASPLALDLLEQLLAFDPRQRIDVDAALAHPYLSGIRDPALEVTCPRGAFDYAFENVELTKSNLQALMFEDICRFHPETLVGVDSPPRHPPVHKKITPT
ncbi:hypothetical protein DYB32_007993 [Aphanomyces invadans]|uniref:Mitogen-activated protein kinase n=1 Tax=Aphanomyces invadans TaxID=157072 RepID=A0A3R6VSR8_9STRA|nr:hypothetical protein DYB32_007993 [Aphanomyces invadans]